MKKVFLSIIFILGVLFYNVGFAVCAPKMLLKITNLSNKNYQFSFDKQNCQDSWNDTWFYLGKNKQKELFMIPKRCVPFLSSAEDAWLRYKVLYSDPDTEEITEGSVTMLGYIDAMGRFINQKVWAEGDKVKSDLKLEYKVDCK